jgi:uncharacterized OB-fold protein
MMMDTSLGRSGMSASWSLSDLAAPADPDLDPADVVDGSPLRLRASVCPTCDRTEVPPRASCGACDTEVELVLLPSSGTLRLATSVLHPAPDALVEAPYHVGVATFDDRRSVLGLLTDDAADRLGARVETVAREFAPGRFTYAFRPGGRPSPVATRSGPDAASGTTS